NTTLGKSAVSVTITDNTTWVKTYTEAFTSGATKSLTSFISAIDTYVDNASSGSPTAKDLATALTKINVGIKAIDFSQVMGSTLISDSGTFESGVTQSSFDTNLSGKVTTVITAAADTIGDVLGTETAASFPNATIKILSDEDDTADGTANSDLIATLLGDDTVNGLAGNDKIIGGSGTDTFDGGEGDDHLYGYTGNDVLSGGDGNDKIIGGLGDDIIRGGAGDDNLQGQTGNDTITTGSGSDNVEGGLGDDTINVRDKSGSFTDTISGSSGTDTLDISYSGVTSLANFSISTNGDNIILTDASGGSITYSNIENLTVGDYDYIDLYTDRGAGNEKKEVYWNATEKAVYFYGDVSLNSGVWQTTDGSFATQGLQNLTAAMNVTVTGHSGANSANLNVNRNNDYTGNWTINLGDGDDSLLSAKLKNGDSIDMGAGDDVVYLMLTGSNGTPTISAANLTKLDGGAGNDTLGFEESGSNTSELTLTTAGATNFENIIGTAGAETIKGDNNANVLTGKNGADTLYGYGGNDTLHADSNGSTNQTSSDVLYGGAGDDTLYGNAGDNTLDGGTGADTITSGGGSDMVVLRSGDGGATQSDGDTVTDFTDGTDSLGLDSSLTFSDLTIEQIGSDTVIKEGSNYLATLTGIAASNITVLDFQSTSTDDATFTGTSGNDTLIGGAGGDTFNGGAGSDTLLGWGGDDTFNIRSKTGSYADTVNGGAGTDTLDIKYSSISNLGSFTITSDGGTVTLTDSSGGSISYDVANLENLTVNDITYTIANNTYWNSTEKVLYAYDAASISSSQITGLLGLSASDNLTIKGTDKTDTLNLNIDRSSELTGNLTLTLESGTDSLNSAKLKNGDSIDMGAGDDSVSVMLTGSNGTPSISAANLTKLDGGTGNDTLGFEESGSNTSELTLTTAGATNFENIIGTAGAETITGDSNANILSGKNGADTINGNGGNDTLYADSNGSNDQTSADALYGGAGIDTLYGNDGDNILDGGTGADTITSYGGSDTIILRSGDGGATQSDGDTVTDFTDGTDSFGLDSLSFDDLTIEQNESDTVIKEGSNYLATLTGIAASNITVLDFQSTSTDDATFTGTSGNDTLIGGAGGDTFNGGAGSDTLLGWGGDDTFNIRSKTGSYADTVNGGAGTDTLDIKYSSISNLGSFTITSDGGTVTLTDSSGGSISYDVANLENLTVNDITYTIANNTYWNSTEKVLYAYDAASISSSQITGLLGLSASDNLTIKGTDKTDTLNLNIDRSSELTGNLTLTLESGTDSLNSAKLKNGDSIDMGAGDDSVSVMLTGSNGTPSISAANLTKLDGGTGNDTLSFEESTPATDTELTLTTAGATNFENLSGGSNAEVLKGDNNANILNGKGGADTFYGYGGNDTLNAGSGSTNDILYGGAGNDTLVGTDGDNTLDGGTGADTITSGGGVDTFVIRVGSGGSAITDADTFTDFTDGTDLIGLDNGLTFADLTIEQGTGSYSSHTIVKAGSEYLAIVQNITASDLTESSFTPVNINESGTENASIYLGYGLLLDNSSLSFSFVNDENININNDNDFNVNNLYSGVLPIIDRDSGIEININEDFSEMLIDDNSFNQNETAMNITSSLDYIHESEEFLFIDSEILV
ncbi:hypothetical protein OAO62_02090, partial [Gammaproteobacteria bacterium]|nr:hypothetical protein [Gammaproteobacteria bacterium]